MTKHNNQFQFSLIHFILAVAILSVIQSVLIIVDVLPTLATYSAGTVLFSILKLAVVIYAGFYYCGAGLKRSVLNGALFGFVSTIIIAVLAYFSTNYLDKPIIGISVPSLWLAMIILIVENVILFSVVSLISCLISGRLKKK